jgi:hypothetical protein
MLISMRIYHMDEIENVNGYQEKLNKMHICKTKYFAPNSTNMDIFI